MGSIVRHLLISVAFIWTSLSDLMVVVKNENIKTIYMYELFITKFMLIFFLYNNQLNKCRHISEVSYSTNL